MRQCEIEGCDGKHKGRGLCQKHLQEKKRRDSGIRINVRGSCTHPGCIAPHKAQGLCDMHYERIRRNGDASITLRRANGEGCVIPNSGVRVRIGTDGGSKYVHVLMAEKAVGKELPEDAVVHHINGDNTDNRNDNFVICQDQSYHLMLHQRTRAYDACGHADWLKCPYCKKYDDPANMHVGRDWHWHRSCMNEYQKQYQKSR